MAICGCPEAVVYLLRQTVQAELTKLLSVLRITSLFDTAIADIAASLFGDIQGASSGIPSPASLNVGDLASYLTCPLLPLALALSPEDFQALDPRLALDKLKRLKEGEIRKARQTYDSALNASPNSRGILDARKYTRSLQTLKFDATSFVNAVLIAATVLTTCGEEEYRDGPYQDFANAANGFSMTNGIPSTLSQNSQAVVQQLLLAEAKFEALRATLAI